MACERGVKDLKADGVELYHGLSGELPSGLAAVGIPGVVTVHDLIFLRHPEFYPAIDVFFYKRKFYPDTTRGKPYHCD